VVKSMIKIARRKITVIALLITSAVQGATPDRWSLASQRAIFLVLQFQTVPDPWEDGEDSPIEVADRVHTNKPQIFRVPPEQMWITADVSARSIAKMIERYPCPFLYPRRNLQRADRPIDLLCCLTC
jgi:hypothetical protein